MRNKILSCAISKTWCRADLTSDGEFMLRYRGRWRRNERAEDGEKRKGGIANDTMENGLAGGRSEGCSGDMEDVSDDDNKRMRMM
eukprot:763922-Hanusia_phi.AAC.3